MSVMIENNSPYSSMIMKKFFNLIFKKICISIAVYTFLYYNIY